MSYFSHTVLFRISYYVFSKFIPIYGSSSDLTFSFMIMILLKIIGQLFIDCLLIGFV